MKRKDLTSVFRSKKGQVMLDGIYIIIVLFVFALASLFGYSVYSNFNDGVQADNDFHAEAKDLSQSLNDRTPSTFDYAFLFLLIGLWIALIVTSYFIDTHPVWFIIIIIIMIFVFLASMILANTYDSVASDSNFSTFSNDMPIMNWVFNNFLVIMIFIVMSSLITMFAKSRFG